jgi:DNA polymerase III gamma/tau subunit
MSLYNKYRPSSLEEIKGNEKTILAIQNFLKNTETMPLVYLLHGETGCGKTTLGRAIKNHLNIKDLNYIEYNASDDRGIEDIKKLIRNTKYKPLEDFFKIYLLDECHQLTKPAQEALLKILEDTPKHVIFILCTTEPEKLGKALRGRCQEFQLELLDDLTMKRLLKQIIRKEKENVDSSILEQIIETAQGHPRNAIQILEKVINVPSEDRKDIAQKWVDEKAEAIELCRTLLNSNNWKKINGILTNLKGLEPESIRRIILGYASSVLLKTDNEKAGLILEEFIEPFYNSGFPGLVYACYSVIKNS